MLIACPTCASEYRIDVDRVGMDGRSVRCAACRETWFITPAEILAAQAAELGVLEEPEPDPVADAAWEEAAAAVRSAAEDRSAGGAAAQRTATRRPKHKTTKRRGIAGLSPMLALGLTALAALPLACLARASVVRAIPQTAGLYGRIGLPVNLRGIEIRDVVAFSNPTEDGRPAELVVEGDLFGMGRSDVPVAALAVEVRDASGHALATFPVPPPRAVLGAGETARFRTRLVAPPAHGRSVELRFADTGPSPSGGRAAGARH